MGLLSRLTPEVQAKISTTSVMAAPVAILLSVVAILVAGRALATQPQMPDMVHENDDLAAVEQFGQDFMTLYLAGTGKEDKSDTPNQARLKEMVSTVGDVTLSPTAYRLENVTVRAISNTDLGETGGISWRLQARAVVIPPGAQSTSMRYFQFDVTSYDGQNYQVTALPRQVSTTETRFSVTPAYDRTADPRSPIFDAAQHFTAAYLTPSKDTSDLGTTVGPGFSGHAVPNPLWQTVTVTQVNYWVDDRNFTPDDVHEGDTIHALITAQASVSSATFSTVQLPVEMIVLSNGTWAVNDLEDIVYPGGVDVKS